MKLFHRIIGAIHLVVGGRRYVLGSHAFDSEKPPSALVFEGLPTYEEQRRRYLELSGHLAYLDAQLSLYADGPQVKDTNQSEPH